MMKHDMAMDPDFIRNFRQEARTVAALNHPHIGPGRSGGRPGRTEDDEPFFFYRDEQRLGLNVLLEEFSRKLKETEIHLKAADFKDIG